MNPTAKHPITLETDRLLAEVATAVALGDKDYPKLGENLRIQLGCPYWNFVARTTAYPLLKTENRVAAQEALPRLLQLINIVGAQKVRMADTCALLMAIHGAGQWRDCLGDMDNAYGLAASICLVVEILSDPNFDLDAEDARPTVLALLNEWLDTDYDWNILHDKFFVAERLFGVAWCEVVLSDLKLENDDGDLSAVIAKERPPFLPGLCRGQDRTAGLGLPDGIW
jgi:hypothetical protein